jgi:hypothetical protein
VCSGIAAGLHFAADPGPHRRVRSLVAPTASAAWCHSGREGLIQVNAKFRQLEKKFVCHARGNHATRRSISRSCPMKRNIANLLPIVLTFAMASAAWAGDITLDHP